jgi:transcriptional regulator with XRE-family HTH domain
MEEMKDRIDRLLLAKNGGNQSELARFVGVTPQAVQKWVSGDSEPKGGNLRKAAEFLNVSPAYLRFGSDGERAMVAEPVSPTLPEIEEAELLRVMREMTGELKLLAVYRLSNPIERQTIENAISIVCTSIDQRYPRNFGSR